MTMRSRRRSFYQRYVYVPQEMTIEFAQEHLNAVLDALEHGKHDYITIITEKNKPVVLVSAREYEGLIERLDSFDHSKHGGEAMAFKPVGEEFPNAVS